MAFQLRRGDPGYYTGLEVVEPQDIAQQGSRGDPGANRRQVDTHVRCSDGGNHAGPAS